MYRCFEEKMHLKANLLQKNFPANAFRLQCSDLTSYKQFTQEKYIPGQTSIKSASAETEIKEEKKYYFQNNLRTDFFAALHQNLSTD